MDSLKNWNKKTTDKTYSDLKIHMRNEYNELRQVSALSIRDSKLQPQLHNVNTTPQDLGTQISSTITNDLRSTIMDAIMALNSTADSLNETSTIPQVNLVTNKPNKMQQLCKLVTELHQEVKQLKAADAKPGNNSADFNPKTGEPWRRYCHTHG